MFLRHPFGFVLGVAALSAVVLAAGQAPKTALPAAPSGTYANPVIDLNFPDPSVLRAGSLFYLYGTNSRLTRHGPDHNMVCASSPDLVH